jgi:hypothetical protein
MTARNVLGRFDLRHAAIDLEAFLPTAESVLESVNTGSADASRDARGRDEGEGDRVEATRTRDLRRDRSSQARRPATNASEHAHLQVFLLCGQAGMAWLSSSSNQCLGPSGGHFRSMICATVGACHVRFTFVSTTLRPLRSRWFAPER